VEGNAGLRFCIWFEFGNPLTYQQDLSDGAALDIFEGAVAFKKNSPDATDNLIFLQLYSDICAQELL